MTFSAIYSVEKNSHCEPQGQDNYSIFFILLTYYDPHWERPTAVGQEIQGKNIMPK